MAISAAHTVTFIALKRGLLTGKAADYVGRLHYASLGIKAEFDDIATNTAERISYKRLAPSLLPLRKATAHKGSFGKVIALLIEMCIQLTLSPTVGYPHRRLSWHAW